MSTKSKVDVPGRSRYNYFCVQYLQSIEKNVIETLASRIC